MSKGPPLSRPKFAEAITQLRHANTVIARLPSRDGLRPVSSPDHEPSDRTVVHGADGFGAAIDPDHTDPSLQASPKPDAAPQIEDPTSRTEDKARAAKAAPIHAVPLGVAAVPITAAPRPEAGEGKAEHGKIFVVFGCRGGAGATTIAVNLGAELARSERGSVVVDLDLQMGDVLCALDLQPTATIAELVSEIDELDEASLRRRLTDHRSGVFAIAQGDRFDQLESLRPDRIPALIAGLSRQFGSVMIDGLRDFSDLSIAALDMADLIVLVVPEDVPGVKNASRCLEVFRRLGYGDQKIAIVVNRHHKSAKVSPAAIAETLQREPLAVLAEDARTAQTALDEGRPISDVKPGSELSNDVALLAARLTGKAAPPVRRGGLGGLIRSLFGGRS